MNGLIIILSTEINKPVNIPIYWKQPFNFQPSFFNRKCFGSNYQIEQFSSFKFGKEKFWLDTDEFLFVNEGIIHNINDLNKQNKVPDTESLIKKYWAENNKTFFNQFEGNYAGIFYDKKAKILTAFNNKTGMKKLFYYQNQDYVIFSTDLKSIVQSLKALNISFSLDEESAYLLLSSGFMHENLTLINEVKQIRAGEYCVFENGNTLVNSYFNLKNIAENSDNKKVIIEKLDYLFKNAVSLEFEIDKRNNYHHVTTLSGGLDSRMTALIAYKLGYHDQLLFNFSEKGYSDEVIAKQIAEAYQMELSQIVLNEKSLVAIDAVVNVNDGQTIYSACSHAFSALSQLESNNNGIVHTGMIGDAVMGSFVSKITNTHPKNKYGLYSTSLFNKVENVLNKTFSNYPSEELYLFYNRAFLGANNGFLYFDLIGESASPFLNSNFLSYAYSIPRKYKFKENIYIEWIKTLHPDIANFTWENIGGKPTNNEYLRFYYRYKRAIVKRLPIKTMWKNNMNPEQLWYDNNENIQITLDSYFIEHIELLNDYKELRDDAIGLYNTGNITEKTQVLTLLSAIKLLF